MEKAKISPIQLFALIYLFELGSAIVVSIGISAKKDAWLAILFGLAGGILLFFMYRYLYLQYPEKTLIGYITEIFGKYLGWIIGLCYIVYFLNISMRVLRDFGDLLLASTLPTTPLLPINAFMILAVSYVVFHGIEVIGRTAEVFIVIVLVFGITGNLLVLISGNVNLQNLLPIFEEGWKPILTATFPGTIAIPFGEIIVFTMLFPYLNKSKKLTKTVLSAMILSGLTLSYTLAINIAVLGVDRVSRSTFPLLSTIGMVNVAEFLQRLDAIVVFTLIIGGFFKIMIFFYGALIGIGDLFKFQKYTQMILPIALIVLYSSMTIASDFSEHIAEGLKIFTNIAHIAFQLIIPLLMLLVSMIRNGFKKKDRS